MHIRKKKAKPSFLFELKSGFLRSAQKPTFQKPQTEANSHLGSLTKLHKHITFRAEPIKKLIMRFLKSILELLAALIALAFIILSFTFAIVFVVQLLQKNLPSAADAAIISYFSYTLSVYIKKKLR